MNQECFACYQARSVANRPVFVSPVAVFLQTKAVAQICNLLYRRIAFGRLAYLSKVEKCQSLADCKSAIQQITNLRYFDGPA